MAKQLHIFEQPQNLFTNLVLNSYEKSWTHNSHNAFIYNTLFLDPNWFIPLIGFTFVGHIFNFMKRYSISFMILKTTICASVNIKIGLLYIPNFSNLNIKLGKTITIPLHQNVS
jgi:hypothetical protein